MEVIAICTASLVAGVIAFILGDLSFIAGIDPAAYVAAALGVLGVVLALVSLCQCKRSNRHTGKSIWGAILSILALVTSVVSIIVTHSY